MSYSLFILLIVVLIEKLLLNSFEMSSCVIEVCFKVRDVRSVTALSSS